MRISLTCALIVHINRVNFVLIDWKELLDDAIEE